MSNLVELGTGLFQCACHATVDTEIGTTTDGHRRVRRVQDRNGTAAESLILPHETGFLLTMGTCPLGSFFTRVQAVTDICCTSQGGCSGAVPEVCSFDCGLRFNGLLNTCGPLLREFLDADMAVYDQFASQCARFDPRSLATALYHAKCADCGDGIIDGFAGEECDEGEENNGSGTSGCTMGCKSCTGSYIATESGSVCVPEGTGLLESIVNSWDDTNRAGKKFVSMQRLFFLCLSLRACSADCLLSQPVGC